MKKMGDFEESQFSGYDENKKRIGVGINGDRSPSGFKTLPNSAARKKILAERNGISHSQIPNSPNSSSRKQPTGRSSKDPFRVSPCSFKISESNHGHENGEDESASYDPMNNFLSPRPKFLRYDPNRRRENFPGREKMKNFDLETLVGSMGLDSQSETEQGESSDCSCVSANPFSLDEALSKKGIGENAEDNDGFEKDDEEEDMEMEEEDAGGRWGLKWALKFMLVLVVLVLSTAYISTMNSPTPPPAVLAVRGLRDECQRFGGELMKYFHEMKDFAGEGGRVLFNGRKDMGAGFFGGEQMRYLYEMKDFAVERGRVLFDGRKDMGAGLFELNESNVDEEGEVESFKEIYEDGEEVEKNFKEEISDVSAVQGENDMIPEEFDTVEDFDEFLFQEDRVVETEGDNENPEGQEGSSESFEEDNQFLKEVGNGDQIVSNGREGYLLRLKESPLLAICSLLTLCASLVLTLYFKFKGSSVETSSSANVLEAMKKLEVAKGAEPNKTPHRPLTPPRLHKSISPNVLEAMKNLEVVEAEPKKTPRRPPAPPRPHKSVSPDVKLISELEFGNFRSPVQNLSPTRGGRSEFTKEKIIVQKEDVRQRIADLSLSSGSTTPVRRSVRIRNRVTSP